jgi:outer membrane biosynthesis protein TonB
MTSRLPISLSLLLLLALPAAFGQTADDYFHFGAVSYLSNNIPQALQTVTNGRALYPDNIKLKKLEELLKQQQQQQQQQNQQDQQKKDQQSKNDQQKQDKKDQQQQKDQQKQQQNPDKPKEQKSEQQQARAAQMTPQQAQRLLDTEKGSEQVLWFKPEGKPEDANKPVKDW